MRRPLSALMALIALGVTAVSAARSSAPASAGGGPAFGVYKGSDPKAVASFEAWVPRRVEVVKLHFNKSNGWTGWVKPSWLGKFTDRVVSANMPPFPNGVGASLAAAARGDYDSYYVTAARNLIAYGHANAHLVVGHEFNGNWFPWTATGGAAGDYVAAWRRIVTIFRSQPGASFKFNWVLAKGAQQMANPTDAYPGDAYVDVVGMDVYDNDWEFKPSQGGDWYVKRWNKFLTMPYGLNWLASFAAAHGKPISIPEWGLTTVTSNAHGGGDNPYYIQKMHDWMSTNNVAYQAYHDSTWYDGDHYLEGSNFPNAAALYRTLFGAEGSGSGLPATTTTTTTTQPTTQSTTTTTTVATSTTTTSVSSSTPTPAALVSDEFSQRTLNTAVWRFINPVGDSLPALDGQAVHLVAGAGKWHTMAKRGNRTVRIVQDVADVAVNVEVKFVSGVTTLSQMQGILLEESPDVYVAIEFRHDGTRPVVRTVRYERGTGTTLRVDGLPRGSGPMWLRVNRAGSRVAVSWSLDGMSFTSGGIFDLALRLSAVGVYSGNNAWNGLKPPLQDTAVDYFRAF